MLKFLSEKYYYILTITVILFVLNLVKERLIKYMFDSDVQKITLIRNVFVYSFYIGCLFIFFLSIILIFDKENNNLNRVILIAVPLLIAIFFLLLVAVFGVKNLFPFH